MKIMTITCHNVYNLGASLQAYALSNYLNSLGHYSEIINYKPNYLSKHFSLWGVSNPKYNKPILREIYSVLKFPSRLKAKFGERKRNFDNFTLNFLNCTDIVYHSYEELASNPPKADVYIAGSDQIWNTLFENGRDPSFYLNFAPKNSIKASYAASFATDDIVDEWKGKVKEWLNYLDLISVREVSGVNIIENLGINKAVQVLDPVFLLDKNKWENIEKDLLIKDKYILVYDFDRNLDVENFVKKYANNNDLKIYSVFKNDYCDKSFENEGPRGFLNLIHNAEFIVSNSFHATAFSMIYRKDFVVFNRKEKINTRMRDLLSLFNLEERLITSPNVELIPIDYCLIEDKINDRISSSKSFIDDILEGIKND